MTALLTKYLEFTTQNKEKLQKATSAEAYECDNYFECFYDGGNDEIYLHSHAYHGEIVTHLTKPEELNEYESELNDCVTLINEEYQD